MNNDETDTRFGILDRFDVPISAKTTSRFPDYVDVDQRTVKENRKFWASLSGEGNLVRKRRGSAGKWLGLRVCKRYLKSYASRLIQNK